MTFIVWGGGTAITQRTKKLPKYAGKIFGKNITIDEYNQSYIATRNQFLMVYGDKFFELEPYLDLEKDAWDRLILLHEAKNLGIKLDDKELQKTIRNYPVFKKDGQFDFRLYKYIVENIYHMEPKEFEEQMRQSLAILKLKDSVVNKVGAEEDELGQAYRKENEKIKASYIIFEADKFREGIQADQEKLNQYFQENKGDFKKPPQANIEYIKVGSLPEDEADNLIYQIYAELQKDKDFEEVAKAHGLEVKETGFFGQASSIPEIGFSIEISKAAFDLKIGQTSRPIKSKDDFFLIKAKERKGPYIPQFEEVEEDIRQRFIQKEARALAKIEAEEFLSLAANSSLEKAAKQKKLSLKQTGEIGMYDYLEEFGPTDKLVEAAFNLEDGQTGPVVDMLQGSIVFRMDEKIPVAEEDYENKKEAFKQEYLQQKRAKEFNKWFEKLKQGANLESNIEKLKAI